MSVSPDDERPGELRIYLGAAPGVGKTFAMPGEGRPRRERGADVVIGFVETHGRERTAEQIGDLEIVPRRTIVDRGATFEEMYIDAVLARHPEVALVGHDPFTVPAVTHVLASAGLRERVVVAGVIRSVAVVDWAGGPVTEATLVDDTDMITLVFFGSRGIAGVHAGRRLVAAGTIGTHRGERVIRSPQLWLEAARHESDDTTWSSRCAAGEAIVEGLRGWTSVPIIILSLRNTRPTPDGGRT